jgi:transcriptional repressor NF-X1
MFTASFPPNANLSRTSCSDPIPTCSSICMRPLEDCSHVCSSVCHIGACPPCSIMLVRPCRCGATTKDVQCSNFQSGSDTEILCDRPCAALRACGRHQCNRLCCPLASLGGPVKGKGKKRAAGTGLWDGVGADETGLHECDLPCGKVLGCGNHRCEERDHRGACPPCLQSSFEEVSPVSI